MFHFSPFTFAHTSIHTHILTNSLYLVAVMRGWIFSVWYVISLFGSVCLWSFWLVPLHWLSQTECWEMPGINSTDTNTLQWETETNRLWHLVIGKPIITEWFNHRLSACFCFLYIFIHHTLFIPMLLYACWFFETCWYKKSSSVTRMSSHPFFDLSSPRVNYFFLGLWSTLSKIACFCCALLQQEELIWHLLPSDLWELTDQRWWRGMSSLSFSASVISVYLSPSIAWSPFFFFWGAWL